MGDCGPCSRRAGARRGAGQAITTCKVVVHATGSCLDDGLGRCRVFASPKAAVVAASEDGLIATDYQIQPVRVL